MRFVVVTFMISLAGCGDISTDPRQGGIIGGIYGINSGAYEERLEKLRVELNEVNRRISQEKGDQTALLRRQAELEAEIRRLRQQL